MANERILIKRAPSWIRTRKRLGERRKGVLGSGSWAKRANMAAANLLDQLDRELIPLICEQPEAPTLQAKIDDNGLFMYVLMC